MEHHFLDIDFPAGVQSVILFQKDNNLDGKDNLDLLPGQAAVFALCGRVNGKAANPRYVGETGNLRESVKSWFTDPAPEGPDGCVLEFIRSIKTKELVYLLLPNETQEGRQRISGEWRAKYEPVCNQELNQVY